MNDTTLSLDELQSVKRQFLGNCPHHLFAWPSPTATGKIVSAGTQAAIAEQILRWAQDRDLLPCKEYTGTWLKRYMRMIEDAGEDADEEIVTVRCMMAASIQGDEIPWERGPDFTVKTWFLDDNCESYISTFEHQRTISGGTTGLKTWPAALAFAEYLLANPALVRGQRILELGSGVGMLGLVIARLGAKQVTMTDAHSEVLKMLRANVAEYQGKNTDSTTDLQVRPLDWFACTTPESVSSLTPDVLLCADTAYDPDLVGPLAQCVRAFLLSAKQQERELAVLMTTALRRQSTFDKLRERLASLGLAHQVVCAESAPVTKFPLDEVGSPIALLKIELAEV